MIPSLRHSKRAAVERGVIGHGEIFSAIFIREPGVLGTDRGIIEPGGNGMRGGDLAVCVLQDVCVCALQNAGARSGKTLRGAEPRGVFAKPGAAAAGFDANHFHVGVAQEIHEKARSRSNRRPRMQKDASAAAFPLRESARELRDRCTD